MFMTSKMFFEYKGAIFWKMTAGTGDIVFAPMYEVLRKRGVEFEFFHRVDVLHASDDGLTIEAITMGRQAALRPDTKRRAAGSGRRRTGVPGRAGQRTTRRCRRDRARPLEAHWCDWPDAEQLVLQRGADFDDAVFAIPVGMAPYVARELMACCRSEWQLMVEHLQTTATEALQLWLRPEERELGWAYAGRR